MLPDTPLTTESAHRIVATQFPQFRDEVPTLLGQGWDNFCIIYPDQTVFRLPTRKVGAEILVNECHALPHLRPQLDLPIPDFQHFGVPQDDYPYPFVGYPLLPGQTADRMTWTDEERARQVQPLANFLNQLHAIEFTNSPLQDLPDDTIFRKDPISLLEKIETRCQILQDSPQTPSDLDLTAILKWARALAPTIRPTAKVVIVHGDLYPRHLIANERRQVTGIIDWGDTHRGHPALDLSLAYTFVPPTQRERFFAAYHHPLEESDLQLAALRAAMYGTSLMVYGQTIDDHPIKSLAHQILKSLPIW